MADNYLEKKFEDMQRKGGKSHKKSSGSHPALDSLLLKNRSCRGYDSSYEVTDAQIEQIINVNRLLASTRNQQVLRFLPLTGEDAAAFHANIKLGGALPELHLPFKGTEPSAYIIMCSTVAENRWVDMDLGISAQSMLLKAVELGLNGICIGSFNKEKAQAIVNTCKTEDSEYLEPLLVIGLGKGIEHIQLLPIDETESHSYFRENGIHYVPKVRNVILKPASQK